MRYHLDVRRVARFILAFLALLLGAAWAQSHVRPALVTLRFPGGRHYDLESHQGALYLPLHTGYTADVPAGIDFERAMDQPWERDEGVALQRWRGIKLFDGSSRVIVVSYWVPLVVCGLLAVLAWRRSSASRGGFQVVQEGQG